MFFLPLLGYLGIVLGFGFLTLAIASGLYYLSELVEEHTVLSKKALTYMIYGVITSLFFLWALDGFPLGLVALSIGSHAIYLQNLRRFPIVKLSDPIFILSCVLVLANHYLWFRHFSTPPPRSPSSSSYPYRRFPAEESPYEMYASFTEVASFFGLCVWLIPFALFVSLSASENVLPSMGSEYATGEGSSFVHAGKEPGTSGRVRHSRGMSTGNAGMAKALVDNLRTYARETGQLMGLSGGRKEKRGYEL